MEMLVLEDEKQHRPQSPSLQKVKVSATRTQYLRSQETDRAVTALLLQQPSAPWEMLAMQHLGPTPYL